MQTFSDYILNEMPAALKSAAVTNDIAKFKVELEATLKKLEKELKQGDSEAKYAVKGAKNVRFRRPDANHIYSWMQVTVPTDAGDKNVEIRLPNTEDISSITDFEFVVDGKPVSFDSKEVTDIKSGISYLHYGINNAAFGKRRAQKESKKVKCPNCGHEFIPEKKSSEEAAAE